MPKELHFFQGDEQKQNNEEVKMQAVKKQQQNDFLLSAQYFNQINTVNGKETIENPENILVLVNKNFALPVGYKPKDLVSPNVAFSFGDKDIQQRYMRKEAAGALENLFGQAKQQGIELFAVSGFRSYEYQQSVFSREVESNGEEQAKQAVALPGQSEHQTGLTMDITSRSVNLGITPKFGDTKEGKWVKDNAYKFGFIIRYPKDKTDITKYEYEPWHLRYVGMKAAKILKDKNLTLEEYFGKVKKV
ncbi:M15 family metallopeptidase [Metabacillus sp. RGM 3146]|uniref:M15 family metallopeptidase n=1 Tax=Metabacillus sp. RGM 3146 TaxID=3401092 RepID=UPI003B9BF0B6